MTSRRTKIYPESGRGLGHVTSTIFGSTVGYPSDSLASCTVYTRTVRVRYSGFRRGTYGRTLDKSN